MVKAVGQAESQLTGISYCHVAILNVNHGNLSIAFAWTWDRSLQWVVALTYKYTMSSDWSIHYNYPTPSREPSQSRVPMPQSTIAGKLLGI